MEKGFVSGSGSFYLNYLGSDSSREFYYSDSYSEGVSQENFFLRLTSLDDGNEKIEIESYSEEFQWNQVYQNELAKKDTYEKFAKVRMKSLRR